MSTEEVKALVEELRYGAEYGCDADLIERAADAIEELVADLGDADAMTELWMKKYEALQAQLPKRGEWIEENRRPRSSQFVCSECHRTAYDPQPTRDKAWRKRCRYAYCPNCGAKMEPPQEDA